MTFPRWSLPGETPHRFPAASVVVQSVAALADSISAPTESFQASIESSISSCSRSSGVRSVRDRSTGAQSRAVSSVGLSRSAGV